MECWITAYTVLLTTTIFLFLSIKQQRKNNPAGPQDDSELFSRFDGSVLVNGLPANVSKPFLKSDPYALLLISHGPLRVVIQSDESRRSPWQGGEESCFSQASWKMGKRHLQIQMIENYRTALLHVFWQPGLIIPKQDKIRDVCWKGRERKKAGEQTVFPFTAPLISVEIYSMQRPFSHA